MKCPYCSNENTSVVESRPMTDEPGIRRRRECDRCTKRFTTYERVGNIDLKVQKRDGHSEEFDRSKLEKGIVKACWKRNVDSKTIEQVVDDIEMKLLNRTSTVVKSTDIGRMVLNRLKRIDRVAYLRFASVYMDFEEVSDFKTLIANLESY